VGVVAAVAAAVSRIKEINKGTIIILLQFCRIEKRLYWTFCRE
jgi:hypothetical protein